MENNWWFKPDLSNGSENATLTFNWDRLGNAYKKIKDKLSTEYTAPALDEMGHPIMMANGEMSLRTSTPLADIGGAVAGIGLPVSIATVGLTATVGGVIGGGLTGKIGEVAGQQLAKATGMNLNTQEMFGDIGGFVGMGKGFKLGSEIGKITPALWVMRNPKISNLRTSTLDHVSPRVSTLGNPNSQNERAALTLLQRAPKRISTAERAGIPKADRLPENFDIDEFIKLYTAFAEKYGYDVPNIPKENARAWIKSAKDLLDQHHTYLRGTTIGKAGRLDIDLATKALGENFTDEAFEIYSATHPRKWDTAMPDLFVGDTNAGIYGGNKAAKVLYPYSKGTDIMTWFEKGDTPIYFSDNIDPEHNYFRGIASPWESFKGSNTSVNELVTVSDKPLIFKGWWKGEGNPNISKNWKASKLFIPRGFTEVPIETSTNLIQSLKNSNPEYKFGIPYRIHSKIFLDDGNKYYVNKEEYNKAINEIISKGITK